MQNKDNNEQVILNQKFNGVVVINHVNILNTYKNSNNHQSNKNK